jgi:ribosome biogenesis GTPase
VAPILVLSKADLLAPELQEDVRAQAWRRWPGLPVLAIGEADRGLDRTDALLDLLEPASTAVLVGLSGAGKSTLLNRLDSGAGARTQAISDAVGKGRHTTTHRELYALPSGALLIDSPGIRELGVWAESGGLDEGFGQLSELAAGCRFADCRHEGEPGCAVREAIAAGSLEADDLEQYRKQQAELAWLATRQVKAAVKAARAGGGERLSEREHYEATADERRWKQIAKFQKQRQKGGG